MNKRISFLLSLSLLFTTFSVSAKDPVSKKEPWERSQWRLLVKEIFMEGNYDAIRDWALMDMHDVVEGTDKVTFKIDETKITPSHPEMLGVQCEYSDTYDDYYKDGSIKQSYIDACNRLVKNPIFRLGGTSSNYVNVAYNIGPYATRKASKIISIPEGGGSDGGNQIATQANGPYRMGYGEMLKVIYTNNPDASIIPCISILTTTPEDAKIIAHFLLDEANESEYGKLRSELYGYKEPIKVAYWEIGNELDQHSEIGREWHATIARSLMEAILEVDPDAKCLACGPSAPWQTGSWGNKEPKIEDWVWYITEKCGDLMWGMSWHPYYDGYGTNYMLWLSDSIKQIMDDTAARMGFVDKDGNPKDFKIVGTEGARYDDPGDRNYPGSANFESALSTAHYLNVMQHRDYYYGNMLHNYITKYVTMWPYLYINGDGDFYLSPTAKLYEVYDEAIGDVQLSSDWTVIGDDGVEKTFSESPYEDWKFSGTAYASADDELTVLILNKSNYREKDVTIDFVNKDYVLTGITTFQAPNMFTFTWDRTSEDYTTITREEVNEPGKFDFHMPNGTVMVLHYKDVKKRGISTGIKGGAGGGDDVTEDLSDVESDFTDIEYCWSKGEINKMKSLGFVNGLSATEFGPNIIISKAELTTILTRALSLDTDYKGQIFTDIEAGSWYEKYANACYARGILTGSEFNPDSAMTLRQMLMLLQRVCEVYGLQTDVDTTQILLKNNFSGFDANDSKLLAISIYNGFINRLYENGNLDLDHMLTRGEATSIIYCLYRKLGL